MPGAGAGAATPCQRPEDMSVIEALSGMAGMHRILFVQISEFLLYTMQLCDLCKQSMPLHPIVSPRRPSKEWLQSGSIE